MSKQKGPDSNRSRSLGKEKIVPVAEGSQQPRAPGWVAPGGANVQSANIEQQGANLRMRGSIQGKLDDQNVGTERGGAGAQQAGWSARQAGQRLRDRGEEYRLNEPRQSGYGGAEQQQVAGNQESITGPAGSMQGGAGGTPRRGDPTAQPASDVGSKPDGQPGRKGGGGAAGQR